MTNPVSPAARNFLRKRNIWIGLVALLAFFVTASFVTSGIAAKYASEDDNGLGKFLGYTAIFLLTIFFARFIARGTGLRLPSLREHWRFNPTLTLGGVILMFACGIIVSPLVDAMPKEWMTPVEQQLRGGLWSMITLLIAAPVLEEFLFRGIIQKNLVRTAGILPGILLGSLIFGAIHMIPQQMVYATLLGFILGTIYYMTGSLTSAIAIHIVNNGLTALFYMLFGTTGIEHQLFGEGTSWTIAYAICCLLLAGWSWAVVRRALNVQKRASKLRK